MPRLVCPLLLSLLLLLPASVAAAEPWRMPVPGARLAAPFAYARSAPFRAGQRRGVDLAARPGRQVLAPCPGRVTYAGPVAWGGRGVSLRCGRLVATELGLATVTAARGMAVAAGQPIGTLGRRGLLRLGARVAADRWGWVDPLPLLDGATEPPPTLLPPRHAPRAPAARGRRRPAPVRAPLVARARVPATAPLALLLWAGVGLLAVGLGVHGRLWRTGAARGARTALARRHPG